MSINFKCPICGLEISVEDRFSGKAGKCDRCGELIRIPLAESPISESSQTPKTIGLGNSAEVQHNVVSSTGFIQDYATDYKNMMSIINETVPTLIRSGEEMRALTLLGYSMSAVVDIHAVLSGFYGIVFRNFEHLTKFGSPRAGLIEYDLVPLSQLLKDAGTEIPDDFIESQVLEELNKVKFTARKNWILKSFILTEIEYMLYILERLVEPEYVPFSPNELLITDADPERQIPSTVKRAVWRRDRGRCAQCGTNEKLEYDHIIPFSRGGSATERNIQLLCELCNRKKATQIS